MAEIEYKEVELPEFGLPAVEPFLHASIYKNRVANAILKFRGLNLNALVVYADREHFGNIAYLTGFEPRYEETLLILVLNRIPTLVVGNESWVYSDISPVSTRKALYQNFNLPGQPRDRSDALDKIFRFEGITNNWKIGVVGWKSLVDKKSANSKYLIEIPSYITDTLRTISGNYANVINVNDIFTDPETGMRVINELDQLAIFEHASTFASAAVKNFLFGVKPKMPEYEAVRLMNINGMPLSAHTVLSTGPRSNRRIESPSSKIIENGEQYTISYGLRGGICSRAGFIAGSENDLKEDTRDYISKLIKPYFIAIAEWYSNIGIGVKGGALYDIVVNKHLSNPFFGITLTPGNMLSSEGWLNTPIFKGSTIELRSGMAFQANMVPLTNSRYFSTNMEDGLALADEKLRGDFAAKYPEAWARIQGRRKFMEEVIGIKLKPEVLPFSNIPAYLPPYILSPKKVMTIKA